MFSAIHNEVHMMGLIFVSLTLRQTPAYTARQRMRCACLLSSFRRYLLCLHTSGWPGELTCMGGWSPIQVVTGPGVD